MSHSGSLNFIYSINSKTCIQLTVINRPQQNILILCVYIIYTLCLVGILDVDAEFAHLQTNQYYSHRYVNYIGQYETVEDFIIFHTDISLHLYKQSEFSGTSSMNNAMVSETAHIIFGLVYRAKCTIRLCFTLQLFLHLVYIHTAGYISLLTELFHDYYTS